MKQSILIIEDCKMTNAMIRRVVEEMDVDILSAYNGEAGIAMAVSLLPDLILLDVQMPGIDGFEVCRRLKADPATAMIPVIYLTAETTLEEKIHGLNLGGSDYIAKPFDNAELQARVMVGLRTKYLLDVLSQKAMIDGVTALWNRTFLDQRVVKEQNAAQNESRALTCIMIDIDHFKQVNDRYGHAMGDHVLRTFGQLLADCCRGDDLVCRYGGEEFVALLPGISLDSAAQVAERIRRTAEQHEIDYCGHKVRITCSLGVSDLASSGPALVADADRAMYEAKQAGRNRVVLANGSPLPTIDPQAASAPAASESQAHGPAGDRRCSLAQNRS